MKKIKILFAIIFLGTAINASATIVIYHGVAHVSGITTTCTHPNSTCMTVLYDDGCGTGCSVDIGIGGSLPVSYNPVGFSSTVTIYNSDGTIYSTQSGVISSFSSTGDGENTTTVTIQWQ